MLLPAVDPQVLEQRVHHRCGNGAGQMTAKDGLTDATYTYAGTDQTEIVARTTPGNSTFFGALGVGVGVAAGVATGGSAAVVIGAVSVAYDCPAGIISLEVFGENISQSNL